MDIACVKIVRNCTDIVRLSTIFPVSVVGSLDFSLLKWHLLSYRQDFKSGKSCLEEKNLPPGKLLIKPKTLK